MKFKVGDEVKVIGSLNLLKDKKKDMTSFIKEIRTINYLDSPYIYALDIDEEFFYSEEELELINGGNEMKKLRIWELEEEKEYICEEMGETIRYKLSMNKNLLSKGINESIWCESATSDVFKSTMEFAEVKKEIDWTKVPKFTRVLVKTSKDSKYSTKAHFIKYDETFEDKFVVTYSSKWVYDNETDNEEWTYCEIDKSVEIKEEWYK